SRPNRCASGLCSSSGLPQTTQRDNAGTTTRRQDCPDWEAFHSRLGRLVRLLHRNFSFGRGEVSGGGEPMLKIKISTVLCENASEKYRHCLIAFHISCLYLK